MDATNISITESLAMVAGVLRQHPCIAEARLKIDEEHFESPKLVAFVVPETASFRVPAEGRCSLIDEDGHEWPSSLCDVSFDGMRLRVDQGIVPPAVGEWVQAHVEASAIGGMMGWLGRVCWQRGSEIGVGFLESGDAEELQRFVQAFSSTPHGALEPEAEVGPRTRVMLDVPVQVAFDGGEQRSLRTLDLSPTGVALSGYEGPDPVGRPVEVRLMIPMLDKHVIPGVVVRQDGDLIGLSLAPHPDLRGTLESYVEMAIRTRSVTAPVLQRWVEANLSDVAAPDAWFVVDRLPEAD